MTNDIYYTVNKKEVLVKLIRTKNKNMYLRIKGDEIVCSAPISFSLKSIDEFISQNIEKFAKHLEVIKANKKYSFEEGFVYLLGKRYDFEIFKGMKKRNFEIVGNVIYIYLKEGSKSETDKYIKDFLKQIVTEKIEDVQRFWEKQMEIPRHEISVVYKTTTWGTNMIGKRRISYSAKLAHYDEKILQYLVVHELAHFNEPNHSRAFWNIVRLYIPNYKEIQKILKLDQSLIEE